MHCLNDGNCLLDFFFFLLWLVLFLEINLHRVGDVPYLFILMGKNELL